MQEREIRNLTIRELTMDDVETTYQYSSDEENTLYMLKNPDASVEETEEYIRRTVAEYKKDRPEFLSYAVICEGEHIGEVFAGLEDDFADIGWIINKKYWGRGYAVLAAEILIERLKLKYQICKFVAFCDSRNLPSQNVMKKLGMTFVGDNRIREYDRDQTSAREWKYILNPQ